MARQKPMPEPEYKHPEPIPKVPKVCATCKGWARLTNDPFLGQCLPSRKALPSPLIMPDMGKCGRWEPAE